RCLRQRCTQACVFAAYFPPDQPAKFANVHKVFKASRVAKILDMLSTSQREDAVNSLAFEVDARLKDPVYSSAGLTRVLQHSFNQAQVDLHSANHKLATYIGPSTMMPTLTQAQIGQMGVIGPSAMMPNWIQPQYTSPQQQHLYEAQLVDVSDVGFAPLASVNEECDAVSRLCIPNLQESWCWRGLARSGLFGIAHGMNHNYTLDENTYPQFLCDDDEEMDLLSFIRTADPIKVRIVAPAGSSSEQEASVDTFFDKGGSGEQAEQGHSASGGKKRKTIVAVAGEPSHPPKKVREDHRTLSGASIGGNSRSSIQRLLAGATLNAEVRGGPIHTLPFVTSSVSATPEREGEVITTATVVTLTVDPAAVTKEKIIKPLLLSDGSPSVGGIDPAMGCFANLSGNDFLVGGIRTVISPDTDLVK
nr:LOB domain-containing protein 36-like [Tanacetum cinerariifolium]